jgi:hypothetical protein
MGKIPKMVNMFGASFLLSLTNQMSRLSIENLSKGIIFHNGANAEISITFTHDDSHTVSNFISKYEEHLNIVINRHEDDAFVFNLNASSSKEIARICDIMSEDIDVTNLEIISTEEY